MSATGMEEGSCGMDAAYLPPVLEAFLSMSHLCLYLLVLVFPYSKQCPWPCQISISFLPSQQSPILLRLPLRSTGNFSPDISGEADLQQFQVSHD